MSTEPEEVSGEQLRIKVARLCGWINVHENVDYARKYNRFATYPYLVGVGPVVQKMDGGMDTTRDYNHWTIPDYCNDLDACHEFEKLLRDKPSFGATAATAVYVQKLENQVFKDVTKVGWSFALLTATAEQRCRAFVATMEGK